MDDGRGESLSQGLHAVWKSQRPGLDSRGLFPIKHKNALGPALTHQALGHRQGLEICRKLDLPGARIFAFEFVCDFQAALVHAAARMCSAFIPPVRIEVRIIVPIELDPLDHFFIGTFK
jgi:hypothetical protein